MKLDYAVAETERPHVLRVGLRYPKALEGSKDLIHEVPVRKSVYETLTTDADRIAYALECAEYHYSTSEAMKKARRAAWDADDKAVEDARIAAERLAEAERLEAERLAELAKWVSVPLGKVQDEKGTVYVQVQVTHEGFTAVVVVALDVPDPTQAIKDGWATAKKEADAKTAELAAFVIS